MCTRAHTAHFLLHQLNVVRGREKPGPHPAPTLSSRAVICQPLCVPFPVQKPDISETGPLDAVTQELEQPLPGVLLAGRDGGKGISLSDSLLQAPAAYGAHCLLSPPGGRADGLQWSWWAILRG